jgi:uncharacterized radical SAM superfamily Fe-S cluster-containing enzyme
MNRAIEMSRINEKEEISKQTFFELSKVPRRSRQVINQLLLRFKEKDEATSVDERKLIEGNLSHLSSFALTHRC